MNPFKRKSSGSSEPSLLQQRWFGSLLSFCILLLIIGVIIEFYRGAEKYANKHIRDEFHQEAGQQERIPLFCELKSRPSWLHPSIVDQIFNETQDFAARNQDTYDRLQNPLDQGILREIAENYTGVDNKGVNHWALRNNAWIKKIVEVRRVISKDRTKQTIEIYAEYRQPGAWVLFGGKCYLVDADFVRLPGEYSPADKAGMAGLMAVTGVDLPAGMSAVPEPSAAWNTPDLAAAMNLINLLHGQRFASQIDAIDVSNFKGRKDSKQVWVVLNTIWPSSADPAKPRVVLWGRPLGEESFYDVSAKTKLKALKQMYMRYSRIDANHDFVDIHTEQIWIPKVVPADDGQLARSPRG